MVVVFGQKRQSREVPFFGFHCQLELHDSNNDTVPVLIRDPAAKVGLVRLIRLPVWTARRARGATVSPFGPRRILPLMKRAGLLVHGKGCGSM